jgi:hypothetical protein
MEQTTPMTCGRLDDWMEFGTPSAMLQKNTRR